MDFMGRESEPRGGLREGERTYAANYRTRVRAAGYLTKYDAQWTKRWSTRRELAILERLLARAAGEVGPLDRLLDLPSGPGRLLAAHGALPRTLVFGDVGEGMVRLALENAPPVRDQKRVGVLANGLELPFADRSFDGVVSVRLAHHLEGAAHVERYLRELLRVARGAVILTFFSARSLKNRVRNVSVRLGRRNPKKSVDPEEVRRIADQEGFDGEEAIPLSRLGSGHLYLLLTRRSEKGTLARRVLSRATDLAQSPKAAVLSIPPAQKQKQKEDYGIMAKRYPAALRARGLHRGGAARAFQEWRSLLALRADGAPVARPLATWPERGRNGPGWLLTEEVAGARTLKEIAASDPQMAGAAVREVLSALAPLHARGWALGDTFAKNILARREGGIIFIDQPRACRHAPSSSVTSAQAGDLARLYKGIRDAVPRDRLAEMLTAYLAERGASETATALARRVEALARRLANETPVTALVDSAKRRIRRLLR